MTHIRLLLAALPLILPAMSASAQDTCRIFTIDNPHGEGMDITRIWVVDTVNFSVESITPLPFFLGATESFDIRVCIKARDGQSYTTQVRYQNTHGTTSYPVTMTAPSTTGVDAAERIDGIMLGTATPNPASTVVRIPLQVGNSASVDVQLYGTDGKLVHSETFNRYQGREISVDVSGVPSGRYVAVICVDDENVVVRDIVVAR